MNDWPFDPIDLLRARDEENHRRYETFRQKLGIYLTVATSVVTILIFVIQNRIKDLAYLLHFNGEDTLWTSVRIVSVIYLGLLLVTTLFCFAIVYFKALSGLYPIALQVVNDESIDLLTSNRLKEAVDVLIQDLKSAAEFNGMAVNDAYSNLLEIHEKLTLGIIFSLFSIVLIVLASIVPVVNAHTPSMLHLQ